MTSATSRLSRVSSAIALSFALAAPALAAGYIKFDGIDGEVASSGRGGEIHVESFSWGSTQSSAQHGGGHGAGKVSVHDISVTKHMDKMTAAKPAEGKDGAKGGNVEFEWKVEEGESAPPAPGGVRVAAGDVDGDGRADTAAAAHDVKSPRDASSGLPTGKRQHKPMMLKAPLDRGSLSVKVPAGMCKVGARYPAAEFGTEGKVYRLTGLVVTGCAAASAGGAGAPTETLSLNYEKITWK